MPIFLSHVRFADSFRARGRGGADQVDPFSELCNNESRWRRR